MSEELQKSAEQAELEKIENLLDGKYLLPIYISNSFHRRVGLGSSVNNFRLLSTAHLLSKGGTFSNTLATAADLSEASLEQSIIDIGNFVDDAGLRMQVKGQKLIIPLQLQFEAQRILKNVDRPGTAERDINALVSMGMLPGGIVVNNYLTDTDAFFIKTDCAEGLKHYQRRDLEVKEDNDFDTENVKFKASERYSFGWTDPRGVYGSPGA